MLEGRKHVLETLAFLQTFPVEKETHPGGWRLGVSDYMCEEVMILLEAKETLTREEWENFLRGELWTIPTISRSVVSTIET